MKNLLFFFYLTYILYFLDSYALLEVKIINNTKREIYCLINNISVPFTYGADILDNNITSKKIIQPKQEIEFYPKRKITINETSIFQFIETDIPCAWIHIFGKIKKIHGYGISIFINDSYKGTICANYSSSIDSTIRTTLEVFEDNKMINFFSFSNSGWWRNESIFPISIKL